MDTDSLVENRIKDGQKLVEELPANGFPVTAAFWIKATDDTKWRFYIASPVVEAEGIAQGYGRLLPLVRRMPQPLWIDPLQIKLIGSSDPIASDVLAILRGPAGARAFLYRWGGTQLGGISVEGAHLYPLPAGVTV